MKFQQLTGPVLAKGLEDTAFYVYNRLAALNEVGGHPERFGVAVAEFHRQNAERLRAWPHAMLAGTTHDTKRSEDVRARISVLSEIPTEWRAALGRWARLNAVHKTPVEGRPAPAANDEYLLYQTLLGAWPDEPLTPATLGPFRRRIAEYMQKATREAKVHTSWINPNEEYDTAVQTFVTRLLPDDLGSPFLRDLRPLQQRVAFYGWFNALAQTLLRLTCPGVPDTYQGTELWDYSLVDPDNRRPVDYDRRRHLLAELNRAVARAGDDLTALARDLLDHLPDGRIKLYVIARALHFRRAHRRLFAEGSYLPLEAAGPKRDHICAFARTHGEETILVAVPRLVVGLTEGTEQPPLGDGVWGHTTLLLPPEHAGRTYRHLYTGERLTVRVRAGQPSLVLADVFRHFPVAFLAPL
jgi:(1->4)-alpha-D-glucan 1-alpha-D-glucosylmutase